MSVKTYRSYRDVPKDEWIWPNFSPAEIACKGTGRLKVHEDALNALQMLRNRLDRPIILTSAYRSPEHNAKVGGAKQSKHLEGHAFDVRMENHDPVQFEQVAKDCGFKGFGYYPPQGFMHIDLGPSRSWGKKFPITTTAFTPEPEPKSMTKSRVMLGGGVAGATTVAQLVQNAFEESSGAVTEADKVIQSLGFIPPNLSVYILGLITLTGVGLAMYARWDDRKKIGVVND